MSSAQVTTVDVAVIGAGWAGLAAARTFLRLRPLANLVILDSDTTVGGVWSKDRLYPNLVAQVRLGLFNYSEAPMAPHNGDSKVLRVTGEMIHAYLHQYAENHNLLRRIHFGAFVSSASQLPDKRWSLALRDSNDVFITDKLIVATGVTSIPFMPDIAHDGEGPARQTQEQQEEPSPDPNPARSQDDPHAHFSLSSPTVIHSVSLGRHLAKLTGPTVQQVMVVGAAKSSYDAVYLLLKAGKKVTWVIRREGGGPLSILPSVILGLVYSIAFASTRLMSHLSPSVLADEKGGPVQWLLQRTTPGRRLTGSFWSLLDWYSGRCAGYHFRDAVALLRPEIHRQSVFWSHSGLGVASLPDFWPTLHTPNLAILRDVVESTTVGGVRLRSGSYQPADYLIMCTGWGDHFGMFDAQHKADIGLPSYGHDMHDSPRASPVDWESYDREADRKVNQRLPFLAKPPVVKCDKLLNPTAQKHWRLYRRMVPLSMAETGDRSLVFLGQIHTIQTPLVTEVQGLWATLYLIGRIAVPDLDTMAKEVALWNAWTRKRYLHQGQKQPYSLYDFMPYVDTLFADMGLNSRRKPNPVAELFSPYHAHDFRGFVGEYLAKEGLADGDDVAVENGKGSNNAAWSVVASTEDGRRVPLLRESTPASRAIKRARNSLLAITTKKC